MKRIVVRVWGRRTRKAKGNPVAESIGFMGSSLSAAGSSNVDWTLGQYRRPRQSERPQRRGPAPAGTAPPRPLSRPPHPAPFHRPPLRRRLLCRRRRTVACHELFHPFQERSAPLAECAERCRKHSTSAAGRSQRSRECAAPRRASIVWPAGAGLHPHRAAGGAAHSGDHVGPGIRNLPHRTHFRPNAPRSPCNARGRSSSACA